MLKLKDSTVNISQLKPELWFAAGAAMVIYDQYNNLQNCVITSGNDGRHKDGSFHYKDQAIDLRVWGFSEETIGHVRDALADYLGRDYDVINERNHIHIEFDPK